MMIYKFICLVGALLISTLCLLFGLMYYYSKDTCPTHSFLCEKTLQCVPYRYWCDCPRDDVDRWLTCFNMKSYWKRHRERMEYNVNCDRFTVPDNCTHLHKCGIDCANYSNVPQNLPTHVTAMSCDQNRIVKLEKETFLHQKELVFLNFDNNRIKEIKRGHLKGLDKLKFLAFRKNEIVAADFSDLDKKKILIIDLRRNRLNEFTLNLPRLSPLYVILLDGNRFEAITKNLFAGCHKLSKIKMENNNVNSIDKDAFQDQHELAEIDLKYNKIMTLPPNIFQHANKLMVLLVGYNPIGKLSKNMFNPIYNLYVLSIAGIRISNIDTDILTMLPKLRYIYFGKFHHCIIYAPKSTICEPFSDGVSSLSDLISKPILRIAVWSISCITCLGNGLVLWNRFTVSDGNRALSVLVKNLAVSDMLMGIYLLIIAITDVKYRGNYGIEAHAWLSSWFCALLGILAMTSSEVSMFILSLMSVERFIVIANPLKHYHAMTSKTATLSATIIWIAGLILAIAPVIYWRNDTKFYGINGMCFPLHIEDPYLTGWEYSAFIFLGLNLIGLMIISYAYIGMFISIWKTRRRTPLSQDDFELALRFFLIVLTDAACWIPIITLKILSMMKYSVLPHLQAWTVIFIVPVNSAINPLLYTFTTPKFIEKFRQCWYTKTVNYELRKSSSQDFYTRRLSTDLTSGRPTQLTFIQNNDSDN